MVEHLRARMNTEYRSQGRGRPGLAWCVDRRAMADDGRRGVPRRGRGRAGRPRAGQRPVAGTSTAQHSPAGTAAAARTPCVRWTRSCLRRTRACKAGDDRPRPRNAKGAHGTVNSVRCRRPRPEATATDPGSPQGVLDQGSVRCGLCPLGRTELLGEGRGCPPCDVLEEVSCGDQAAAGGQRCERQLLCGSSAPGRNRLLRCARGMRFLSRSAQRGAGARSSDRSVR